MYNVWNGPQATEGRISCCFIHTDCTDFNKNTFTMTSKILDLLSNDCVSGGPSGDHFYTELSFVVVSDIYIHLTLRAI